MRKPIDAIESCQELKKQAPLAVKDVIEAQKDLVKAGLCFLPEALIELLKIHNGIKGEDGAVLGINPKDDTLDIVRFNKAHNTSKHKVIIGYDDFAFLVYDEAKKKYLLLDRSDGLELDDFLENELTSAVSSVLHF